MLKLENYYCRMQDVDPSSTLSLGLASPAMGHVPLLYFQLFNLSGHFRTAQTLTSTQCGCE